MAAKKDTVDASADEEAGLVPKALADDDYTDDTQAVDDAVVEAVEFVDDTAASPDAGPPHSTPSSPLEVSQARALFEDQVNADAASFADLAASEYIRATLGGFPISIVVDDGLD